MLYKLLWMQTEQKQRFAIFQKWFTENGGKVSKKVQFPVAFQPTGYIGMGASQNIPANQVILGVPQKLIISVSLAKQSQIKPIIQQFQCLKNQDSDETDFNILTLFLIYHKMLKQQSFYYPYLECVQKAQTILQWSEEDIQKLSDPYITSQFVAYVKQQFPTVFEQFKKMQQKYPKILKQQITWDIFMNCYALVMTRCFGWGLPETMMVPYADFLNHDCRGVHHYAFNSEFEFVSGKGEYIKKGKELDLQIFGIDNKQCLPVDYKLNPREEFVLKYSKNTNKLQKLDSSLVRSQLSNLQNQLLPYSFEYDIYPSSNSQDNDSEQDVQSSQQQTKTKFYHKQLSKIVKQQLEPKFQQPKPLVNRQFEDEVTFSWWNKQTEQNNYFIVSTQRYYRKGQQIFNSYGRRSNRFLLIWYGFTHLDNKYDSLTFRFWNQEVYAKTGQLILAKCLTEKDFKNMIKLGGERFQYGMVTDQYRLKRDSISYELIAYLRLRVSRKNKYKNVKKQIKLNIICNLELQEQMLEEYLRVLKHLNNLYNLGEGPKQLSTKQRAYFANLLIQSNRQILQNHFEGIKILKNLLQRIKNGMKIEQIYQSCLTKSEQKLLQSGKQEQAKKLKVKNRKFVYFYFKMLDRYLKKKKNISQHKIDNKQI